MNEILKDPAPSEVRRIILEEHAQLRSKLAEMEGAMIKVSGRQGGAEQEMLNHLLQFNQMFLDHIALEEKILRGILKTVDAWGEIRVKNMDEEHSRQRGQIQDLVKMMNEKSPSGYLNYLRDFVEELYRDMAIEEQDCLSADVLRDDVISINASSS